MIPSEVSFFTRLNLKKLDHHLKNILDRQDKPYGGMSVVFSGDLHQLCPVKCESHAILYEAAMNGMFEGSINTAIFLENSHHFNEYLDYGSL